MERRNLLGALAAILTSVGGTPQTTAEASGTPRLPLHPAKNFPKISQLHTNVVSDINYRSLSELRGLGLAPLKREGYAVEFDT